MYRSPSSFFDGNRKIRGQTVRFPSSNGYQFPFPVIHCRKKTFRDGVGFVRQFGIELTFAYAEFRNYHNKRVVSLRLKAGRVSRAPTMLDWRRNRPALADIPLVLRRAPSLPRRHAKHIIHSRAC